MNHDSIYRAFIGTNSVRGSEGIYTVEINPETGENRVIAAQQLYNTGCVCLSADHKNLYAASEGMTFDGKAAGGVTAFRVEQDGTLTKLNGRPSSGQRTCCVAADREKSTVYSCDFYKGFWNAWSLGADGSLGAQKCSVPPGPGDWLALHCIAPIDGEYLAVMSLAEAAVVVYRTDGTRVTAFHFAEHAFPRYLAVAENTIYAMLQMPDEIYVLENHLHEDGTLKHVQTIGLMDDAHRTMPATSTLRITPDQRLLLAANRPSNSVTVYSRAADGRLTMENLVVIPGNGPRDFNISPDGKIIVVAMQHSDEVVALKIDYENKTLIPIGSPVHVPSPAAVAIMQEDS